VAGDHLFVVYANLQEAARMVMTLHLPTREIRDNFYLVSITTHAIASTHRQRPMELKLDKVSDANVRSQKEQCPLLLGDPLRKLTRGVAPGNTMLEHYVNMHIGEVNTCMHRLATSSAVMCVRCGCRAVSTVL
jgi:hypothetical protein